MILLHSVTQKVLVVKVSGCVVAALLRNAEIIGVCPKWMSRCNFPVFSTF